jgi:hypothetical protein
VGCLAQFEFTVLDLHGNPVANAEVSGTYTGHGGILGNTYEGSFQKYTNSKGQCFVCVNFDDNYDVAGEVQANGYYPAPIKFTTGAMTGTFGQTIRLTPQSSKSKPPGQGETSVVTSYFSQLQDYINGQAGAMGGEFVILIVAIAIILIVILLLVLRFGGGAA